MDGPWTIASRSLGPEVIELRLGRSGAPARWRDVIDGWREDPALREAFSAALAAAPWEASFWECPPLVAGGLGEPFACVVLPAPSLAARSPEPHVFAQELASADQAGVASFPNLGHDARLVVPAEQGDPEHYGHLAAFLRGAPGAQRHALWRAVARAMDDRLGERPVWLSTSGLGVTWLHVRLDDAPKYYQHDPYRVLGRAPTADP